MSERRVAVVTGGAQGIGRAIAEALAADGCAVAVWDIDETKAKETGSTFDSGFGMAVDVSDLESVRSASAAAAAVLGGVDVLVNNAGIDVIGPFLESDPHDWDRVIAVNYRGQLNTCFTIAPGMVERGWDASSTSPPTPHESLAKAIPMRRTGRPEDIAPVVAFLASEGAGYVTGQTLSVSAGLTMA